MSQGQLLFFSPTRHFFYSLSIQTDHSKQHFPPYGKTPEKQGECLTIRGHTIILDDQQGKQYMQIYLIYIIYVASRILLLCSQFGSFSYITLSFFFKAQSIYMHTLVRTLDRGPPLGHHLVSPAHWRRTGQCFLIYLLHWYPTFLPWWNSRWLTVVPRWSPIEVLTTHTCMVVNSGALQTTLLALRKHTNHRRMDSIYTSLRFWWKHFLHFRSYLHLHN